MSPPTSVLAEPTQRPNEALMTGAGQQTAMPQPDQALYELRALAQRYRYPDFVRFVERRSREA
jgi:hypothetical protein